VGIHRVLSDGFAFQIELAYLCLLEGIPVVEIPIEFKDRQIGYSKASNAEIWQALACVSRLRRCYLLPHSTPGDNSANTAVQQVSWQDPHDAQNQDSAEHPLAAAVVGVLAHNEEATIEASLRAILAEDDGQTRAARVVVITSGCTDRTEEIVRGVASRDPRVRLIVEARRNGKVAAINLLLRETTEPLVVVLGGDMVFAPGSLLKLLAPFRDEKVGMTGARPIPTNPRRGIVGNAVNILWDLHHELSLRHPKLGEAVAFRRTVDGFGQDTIFDEATMEYLVQSKGLRLKYVPEAIVRSRGPETMRDYVAHRTRNHRGHLALASVTGYRVATMNGPALARAAWKLWRRGEHAHNIALAIAIEVFTRTRARWSRAVGQRETPIWQAIPSTKRVVAYGHVLRAHHDSFETIQFVQAASTKRATKRMPRQAIRKMLRSEDRLRVGSNNVRITVRSDITGALALRSRLQAELANYSYVPSDQARLTAEDCHNPA
jgi:hypothetical protein